MLCNLLLYKVFYGHSPIIYYYFLVMLELTFVYEVLGML